MSTSESMLENSPVGHTNLLMERYRMGEIPLDELFPMSGSIDPHIADEATKEVQKKWNLEPERDAQYAPTVDIMEQFKDFEEFDVKMILRKLVAIQLTTGCNGGCRFCAFGKKKGVTEKYSFESLQKFVTKYGSWLPFDLSIYWDSDPFDYRDGEKTYLDVHEMISEAKGVQLSVTTAIPKGGERDFVKFMKHYFKKDREEGKDSMGYPVAPLVRISLGKHNLPRINATFRYLMDDLLQEGYTEDEIATFLYSFVTYNHNLEPGEYDLLGDLIGKKDPVKDLSSPACVDGVVISPSSVDAIMLVAPTIYEPSGQKNVPIRSNIDVFRYLPRRIDKLGFVTGRYMEMRILHDQIILPKVISMDGFDFFTGDTIEDLSLHLGRDALAYYYLITDLYKEVNVYEQNAAISVKDLLTKVREAFEERSLETILKIDEARCYCEDSVDSMSSDDYEKVQYYILLAETYLTEASFLCDLIKQEAHPDLISRVAMIFRRVGREQVDYLPGMIDSIQEIFRLSRSEKLNAETEEKVLEIFNNGFSKAFYQGVEVNDLPNWVTSLFER